MNAQSIEQPQKTEAIQRACGIIRASDAGKRLSEREILDIVLRIASGKK